MTKDGFDFELVKTCLDFTKVEIENAETLTECEKYEYKNAIKQVFEVLEVLQIREKGRKDETLFI